MGDLSTELHLFRSGEIIISIRRHIYAHHKSTVKITLTSSSDIANMSVLDKKFAIMFRWYDQNGDGYVDQGDLDKLTAKWTAVASESDHKNRDAIRKGLSVWRDILFGAEEDKNGGKVGEQEFVRLMHTVVTRPKNFDKAIMNIVDGVMGALDHDGNGSLSLEEYVSMYDAIGIPPNHSSDAFKRLDRDGSGEIDPDELKEAIREYYLSDDPNAPGNWLLGPVEF